MLSLLVCYDIANNRRRNRVSRILMAIGPRVQLSVYEGQVSSRSELDNILGQITEIVEPTEDQVRVYVLGKKPHNPRVLGTRELEVWHDYWIV